MKSPPFQIGSHLIGGAGQPFIIAEVGQAHDGSLGTAHAYIDGVAQAGADAVKFQTHFAAEESTLDEPFRVKFSYEDDSRFHYWQRMEFTKAQWSGLAEHARERGLVFLSSPFSVKAVEILREIGVPAWKIGSGEINSEEVLNAMAERCVPVLLSTGMSTFDEITAAVARIRQRGLPFALFQCTSKYPTPLEEVGLNVIDEMRARFDCPVGLSDHSGSVFPGLAALARGVDLLEVHVTFDKGLFGPDMSASITLADLAFLVKARRAFQTLLRNPVDKDAAAASLTTTKSVFSKSVATTTDLPAGAVLGAEMLTLKKPGTGIEPGKLKSVIGRRLRRDVEARRLLRWEDLV